MAQPWNSLGQKDDLKNQTNFQRHATHSNTLLHCKCLQPPFQENRRHQLSQNGNWVGTSYAPPSTSTGYSVSFLRLSPEGSGSTPTSLTGFLIQISKSLCSRKFRAARIRFLTNSVPYHQFLLPSSESSSGSKVPVLSSFFSLFSCFTKQRSPSGCPLVSDTASSSSDSSPAWSE